jgi:hypothetical protein
MREGNAKRQQRLVKRDEHTVARAKVKKENVSVSARLVLRSASQSQSSGMVEPNPGRCCSCRAVFSLKEKAEKAKEWCWWTGCVASRAFCVASTSICTAFYAASVLALSQAGSDKALPLRIQFFQSQALPLLMPSKPEGMFGLMTKLPHFA